MGKRSSSPPAPPDPGATAAAQGQANKEAILTSARINQMNQVTPYGSLTYTGTAGEPDRTRTTTLSRPGQQQLDQYNQLATTLGGLAQTQAGYIPTSQFTLPEGGARPDDFSADRQKVEEATYERLSNLLNKDFGRQESRLENKLIQSGNPLGSEGYEGAYDQFNTMRNEALSNAAMDAVRAGGAEQSRIYGLSQSARGQDINEALLQRSQPMNELAALLQGSPATQSPQFGQAAQYQAAPADYQGAANMAYQGQMNQYNAAQQNRQAGLGGLFQLGAAAMPYMLCSPDFKENGRDVAQILPRVEALTVEAWDYKPGFGDGKTHIGPYADQFKELFGVGDGIMIHPVDAFGVCLLAVKELTQKVRVLEELCPC